MPIATIQFVSEPSPVSSNLSFNPVPAGTHYLRVQDGVDARYVESRRFSEDDNYVCADSPSDLDQLNRIRVRGRYLSVTIDTATVTAINYKVYQDTTVAFNATDTLGEFLDPVDFTFPWQNVGPFNKAEADDLNFRIQEVGSGDPFSDNVRITELYVDLDYDLASVTTARITALDADLTLTEIIARMTAIDADLTLTEIVARVTALDADLTHSEIIGRLVALDADLTLSEIRGRVTALDADLTLTEIIARMTALDADLTHSAITARLTAADVDLLYRALPEHVVALRRDRDPLAPYQVLEREQTLRETPRTVHLLERQITLVEDQPDAVPLHDP